MRRLDRVEAEVAADVLVEVLRLGAVVPEQRELVDTRASSLVTIMPPSPAAPRFLLGKKLKQPTVPMLPALRPFVSAR